MRDLPRPHAETFCKRRICTCIIITNLSWAVETRPLDPCSYALAIRYSLKTKCMGDLWHFV